MAGQSSVMLGKSWTEVSVLGSHPFQPKLGPLGRFVWPKRYFQPILATFWPPWDTICDFLGLANGPNWCVWLSSVLFRPFSAHSIISFGSVAYLAYLIILWQI